MATNLKELMEAANAAVPRVTPAEAREMIASQDVLLLDVRDAPELEHEGKVRGALHISRGMLEFRADENSPYFEQRFSKEKTILLYCASGGRSALSAMTLKQLGYEQVYNLGAFKDWVESGGEVEKIVDTGME